MCVVRRLIGVVRRMEIGAVRRMLVGVPEGGSRMICVCTLFSSWCEVFICCVQYR
jgi:hypothetical protein